MLDFENKNDKQVYFNQIKGTIDELNDGEEFCSVTLKLGHENPRMINLSLRKSEFESVCLHNKIGDKVTVRFFITSRKKNDRWYTTATVLDVRKDLNAIS